MYRIKDIEHKLQVYMERKKVALVLGGGAALGFAHIGVIKALESYNIPIDIIVGTSMGALVGAAYAAGVSTDEMKKYASKFKTLNFIDVNFNRSGLFSGKGVMKVINKVLPDENIENLPKTFACVACDLITEKEVVFKIGNVREAVRASLSIPGVFVPQYKEDKILVDGGIINNLPDDVALEMGADIIISVDVMKKYHLKSKPKNVFETLLFSINAQTKEVQKLKSCNSDILMQPDTSHLSQVKFGEAVVKKAITIGMSEVKKHIADIEKLLKNH